METELETEFSLDEHKRRLAAFAAEHRALVVQGPENVDLKLDHSLRVFEEAVAVAASLVPDLAPGSELERAVHLAALYHDMGRFPQYLRWGTFNDRKSEDHGRLGVRAIRKAGVLDGQPERVRKVALSAVILHNRRSLPPHLPPDVDLAARVVRDADKLDIYPVMLAHLEPGGPDNGVVTLGLERDPEAYTPEILEQVQGRDLCEYALMRYQNDFKLLVLSWVYDLNFPATRRAVAERGYVERLAAALPDSPVFRELGARVRADLLAGV